MVVCIALIRRSEALDRIVIVERGPSVVPPAGAVKLRPQILRGTWDFRTGLHTYAAGEAGSDHYRLAAAGNCFKFDHAFIDIHFSEATTINLNIKLGATDRNDRAGRADLECRRSAHALLDLRAYPADHKLEIFPPT